MRDPVTLALIFACACLAVVLLLAYTVPENLVELLRFLVGTYRIPAGLFS